MLYELKHSIYKHFMFNRDKPQIWDAVKNLPKTDLHCHLDGSLQPETIMAIAQKEGIDLGLTDIETLKKKLVCGEKVTSLPQFLEAFAITCKVLQSASAIQRAAYELAREAHEENVWHLEVRFAPQLLTEKGLSIAEVLWAADKGLKKASAEFGISTGIIVCALRVDEPSFHVELAELAGKLKNQGCHIIGFDLAHAENGNPAKNHAAAFLIAGEYGLGRTVHAGEDFGPASIKQAIEDCKAQRVGHGRTLVEDPKLEARCIAENITVECCPSSNVQISLTPAFSQHPFKGYLERGVKATLATDNRLLTGILVSDEYYRAATELDIALDDLAGAARNGFEGAFLPADQKQSLLERFDRSILDWKKRYI